MSMWRSTVINDSRARGVMASMLATIAANLPVFLVGAMAVQVQADLGFGDGALGLAIGGYYAAGALVAPRTGPLVARWGSRRSLQAAAVMSALTLLVAGSAARSFSALLIMLLVGGMANALAQPASNSYLVRIVPAHRLGLALGMQKSAIPAAALVGGLAVPVGLWITWRGVLIVAAVVSVLVARGLPDEPLAPRHHRASGAQRPDVSLGLLVALSLGVGLGSSASNAMAAFTVRGGVEVGLGQWPAALLLIVGSIGGIVVRMVLGARADRRPGHALITMAALFAAASGCFIMLSIQQRWIFLIAMPLAYVTGFAWPGLFHLAIVRSNPAAPAVATGIAMTGGLAGAVAGPILFGLCAETWSYSTAWLSGAALLALACTLMIVVSSRIIERPPSPVSA
jgi:predicted MFS family arabinose efflux permease